MPEDIATDNILNDVLSVDTHCPVCPLRSGFAEHLLYLFTYMFFIAGFGLCYPTLAQIPDNQTPVVLTPNVGSLPSYCMGLSSPLPGNNTLVQLSPCNGASNQIWYDSPYGIAAGLAENSYLGVSHNSATVQAGQPSQGWTVNVEWLTNDGVNCLWPPAMSIGEQLSEVPCLNNTNWVKWELFAQLHGTLQQANSNITPGFTYYQQSNTLADFNSGGQLAYVLSPSTLFNSISPIQSQNNNPPKQNMSVCTITFTNGKTWGAWYTTFYTLDTQGRLRLINACGKDPMLPVVPNQGSQATAPILPYSNTPPFINHGALANVTQVISAGEVDVVNGRIVYIDNCSGHYQPNVYSLLYAIKWINSQGAQGIPPGVTVSQLVPMKKGSSPTEIAPNIRAGAWNCYSYTPPNVTTTNN